MTIEKINLALSMMQESKEIISTTGGGSDNLISEAEARLDIRFPEDYKYFLKKFGTLSFYGERFYGLTQFGLNAGAIPCVIFATESARELGDISQSMVYVKSSGYGPLFSIDLSGADSVFPVVETSLSYKRDKEVNILAESFGDFFYNEIKDAIEDL